VLDGKRYRIERWETAQMPAQGLLRGKNPAEGVGKISGLMKKT
jgi:hypothetical protein